MLITFGMKSRMFIDLFKQEEFLFMDKQKIKFIWLYQD